jgi:hypothetical protein
MAISSSADRLIVPALASAPRPRGRVLIAAAALVLFAAAALAAMLVPGSHGAPGAPTARFHAPDRAFSVVLPAGWTAAGAAQLRAMPSSPAAVLRRTDGRGLVVIRKRAALAGSARSLTRDLTTQLGRRFRGLEPVSARTVPLHGGPAYVYTFARPAAGRVQSVAVAPRGDRTYTLDAVAGAGAPDAAAQVGAILRSFDTPDPAPRS